MFTGGAIGSEMQHVTLEYGGLDCGADGIGHDAHIVVTGRIEAIDSVTNRHSAGHGIVLTGNGLVLSFTDNSFVDNALPSLRVHANQIVVPAAGQVFMDADAASRLRVVWHFDRARRPR